MVVIHPRPQTQKIEFDLSVAWTKTFVPNESDITFRSTGINIYAGKYAGRDGSEASAHSELIPGCRFLYQDGSWSHFTVTDPAVHPVDHYWSPGCTHNFYAIYPYKDPDGEEAYHFLDTHPHSVVLKGTKTGDTYSGINTGTDDSGAGKCEDIMFAFKSEYFEIGMTMDPVQLQMQHACAAISIKVNNASDNEIASVSGLTITGLYDKAESLTLGENGSMTWGTLSDSSENKFKLTSKTLNLAIGSQTELFGPVLLIPQDMASLDVILNFTAYFYGSTKKEYSIELSAIPLPGVSAADAYRLQPGVHYNYNLDITSTNIYCSVSIVDWIEDEIIELG